MYSVNFFSSRILVCDDIHGEDRPLFGRPKV